MKFIGSDSQAQLVGVDQLLGKSNYFGGSDPAKWARNVQAYAAVRYKGVYPGIDLVYRGDHGQLEYDFIVAPGADYKLIRFAFDGVKPVRIDSDGNLEFRTPSGVVRQYKPFIYQEMEGTRTEVVGHYVVKESQEVSFEISEHDRSRPLIIDPVLIYSTFLGGDNFESSYSVATDTAGNAYICGETGSTNFPTQGAFQNTTNGSHDGFIAKFSSGGNQLLYSTYFGGTGDDVCTSLAVDPQGNAYVTGTTRSTNFPTQNALQGAFGGGFADAFIAKLSPDGSQLVYSTYLGGGGGSNNEAGNGVAVDTLGNVFVTGYTQSHDFPIHNALQPAHGAGLEKIFISKLNASGNQFIYSTYLGGGSTALANAIALDGQGNVYLTGYTTDNFSTQNPIQGTHGGDLDAFITKLNASGNQLVYSTYLGGGNREIGFGIAVDAQGSTYVTGTTHSSNFPTANAFQPSLAGFRNGFVTRLNPAGTQFVYSTYLGGSNSDESFGIAVDAQGNANLTGQTASTDFPVVNAHQPTTGGGFDAFFSKLSANGSQLLYSTYLGGNAITPELGKSVTVDAFGNAYITGVAASNDFPTRNPLQGTIRGSQDAFILKFSASIPLLRQDDPSWFDEPYDHINETMAESGCGTTSLAMVVLSYGVTVGVDGLPVTPKNLNNWLKANRVTRMAPLFGQRWINIQTIECTIFRNGELRALHRLKRTLTVTDV